MDLGLTAVKGSMPAVISSMLVGEGVLYLEGCKL